MVLFLTGAACDVAPKVPLEGAVDDEGGNEIDIPPGPDPGSFGVCIPAD